MVTRKLHRTATDNAHRQTYGRSHSERIGVSSAGLLRPLSYHFGLRCTKRRRDVHTRLRASNKGFEAQ